jgi:hypothetical protein
MYFAPRRMLFLALSIALSATAMADPAPSHLLDRSDGGHMDTDFGVASLAESWYFNGTLTLESADGDRREIGFFLAGAHQEGRVPPGGPAASSYISRFRGLFLEDGTTRFDYNQTFVPREAIGEYVALGTPYVDFTYPTGNVRLAGSALTGYRLRYDTDDTRISLHFIPTLKKARDDARAPLRHVSYTYDHGAVVGIVVIDGRHYFARGSGHFDHRLLMGETRGWAQTFHGWSWAEVTTPRYQGFVFATRSLASGYEQYDFKHLRLLDRLTGQLVADHSGDDVTITEVEWMDEPAYRRRRPLQTIYSAGDVRVSLRAEQAIPFDTAHTPTLTGFVNFMSHERESATIEHAARVETGDSFAQYLVTEMGVAAP